MSKWCAQCHDNWHEGIVTSNVVNENPASETDPVNTINQVLTRQWHRHPVSTQIPRKAGPSCATDSGGLSCHPNMLDRTNYSLSLIQAGKGLPVTTSQFYSGYVYYLPYETPAPSGDVPSMDGTFAATAAHKVFCLTCHFAHGGPYYDNLRWNHTSSVEPDTPQSNPIPKDVGC